MKKSMLHDDFVLFNKQFARLKVKTSRLQSEETSQNNIEESEDIKNAEENCDFCKGDEKAQAYIHIQDLCPADRKRIAKLIEKLAECTQAKNKLELDLAEARSENEALIIRHELLSTKQEADRNDVESELLEKTQTLEQFRLQTLHSLELLTDQVKCQQQVYLKLMDSVKELLRQKMRLENAVLQAELSQREEDLTANM